MIPLLPTTTTLITAAMAAREAGVTPEAVRKWVQLCHLPPAARQGRANLFRSEDVSAAERATRRPLELRPRA
ncbi:hypothetical protein I5Q34_12760 [Streptomyces sp. AV19]|uniref:hypothetical protein n=1 Tax=Streptomyces sp. AV19 TaxID=2793068 RepID=UPI0018FECF78|nr:hypothetical protein [Streptomyces sp. AV19]MBH1935133.1 hypothetical protein [Streptomyces sp. AV19]MDG4531066.1 hypothetical protein [Streptomyces sp. AV19]